jgi:hypothetical protein
VRYRDRVAPATAGLLLLARSLHSRAPRCAGESPAPNLPVSQASVLRPGHRPGRCRRTHRARPYRDGFASASNESLWASVATSAKRTNPYGAVRGSVIAPMRSHSRHAASNPEVAVPRALHGRAVRRSVGHVTKRALLTRGCVALLIGATTAAALAAGAAASGRFPRSTYPPSIHGRGAVSLCPNPEGLEPFTQSARRGAIESASRYGRVSETVDVGASDRAWWPQVRALWRTGQPAKGAENQVVDGSEALGASGYAVITRFSCGQSLVSRSLEVTIGPRNMRCEACRAQLWFVNRRGHALLYYVY